jgi:uncharacterized protein YdeI (YjbR/CyaY-like superfamily)
MTEDAVSLQTVELKKDQPILLFASADAWDVWLAEHHADSNGVWVKLAKKGSGIASIKHLDALDVALCHGWIDGQGSVYDDDFWLVRFSPRTARSRWSRVNQGKVAVLIKAGRMRPAGLAAIEAAKADGRWDAAHESQATSTVPDDLQQALDENPQAASVFATLNKGNRFAILLQVGAAKKPETRAARIAKFVAKLSDGETVFTSPR